MQLTSKKSMRTLLAVSMVALLGWGCSGQQQDEENLEATDDQQANNVGADDAAEGNGQENYENNDQAGDNDNAEVNNDTANDAAEGGETADANPTLDGQVPAETPPIQNASAAPAMDPAAASAPAAPAEGAPVPGGRVRYVKEGGVQVVSAPGGGQPVMTLEQGEHPVTWEENGYLRISNGLYVPIDSMSDKGVPRPGQHSAGSLAH